MKLSVDSPQVEEEPKYTNLEENFASDHYQEQTITADPTVNVKPEPYSKLDFTLNLKIVQSEESPPQ